MLQTENGLVFILIGPTGAGKNTIIKEVQKLFPEIKYLTTCTTRAPREGENQGNPYWFLTFEEFQAMVNQGELLEWQIVHGNMYGTPKRAILEAISSGQDAMRDIEVLGAIEVQKSFPENTITIFVLPPSLDEIKRRLALRDNPDNQEMAMRLKRAEMEINYIPNFKYLVHNENLAVAVQEVAAIIVAERAHRELLTFSAQLQQGS